jgi:hypothetical protein
VALVGEGSDAYSVLVGKPEGNRTLGRSRRKREHNIRSGLSRNRMGACIGLNLAQERYKWRSHLNVVMNRMFL